MEAPAVVLQHRAIPPNPPPVFLGRVFWSLFLFFFNVEWRDDSAVQEEKYHVFG